MLLRVRSVAVTAIFDSLVQDVKKVDHSEYYRTSEVASALRAFLALLWYLVTPCYRDLGQRSFWIPPLTGTFHAV